jgi:hypothetical protein
MVAAEPDAGLLDLDVLDLPSCKGSDSEPLELSESRWLGRTIGYGRAISGSASERPSLFSSPALSLPG